MHECEQITVITNRKERVSVMKLSIHWCLQTERSVAVSQSEGIQAVKRLGKRPGSTHCREGRRVDPGGPRLRNSCQRSKGPEYRTTTWVKKKVNIAFLRQSVSEFFVSVCLSFTLTANFDSSRSYKERVIDFNKQKSVMVLHSFTTVI